MSAGLILPAYPRRQDCPDWRSSAGASLAACVAEWLRMQIGLGRLPVLADAGPSLSSGDYCGVREAPGAGRIARGVLITQSAVTACITELGLECATPRALHHVLVDLVDQGLLQQEVELHAWPGAGTVASYLFDPALLDVYPTAGGVA